MPIEEYKKYSEVFGDDLYSEISLEACVNKRISAGSTGYDSVNIQIKNNKNYLKKKGK
jgi:argininosuccinate lyase